MERIDFRDSLIVGVDVHKGHHTAVLVNPFGQTLGEYEVTNSEEEIAKMLEDINQKSQGKQVLFALEDSEGNGKYLSRYLNRRGYAIYCVPSVCTERERKRTAHTDKSDLLDAKRVAKVLLTESDKLPKLIVTKKREQGKQIRQIVADYNDLVKERAKLKNQLHVLLPELFGDHYRKSVSYKDIFCKRAREEWKEMLSSKGRYLSKRISMKLEQLDLLEKHIVGMKRELKQAGAGHADMAIMESITGNIIGSEIIGEIQDISKFKSAGALAKYCGIAPREHSSGSKTRHYTNHRGNRKLHKAFYKLALSQLGVRGSEEAKEYFRKKVGEGKSKLHAMRCLMRRLVDIVFQMLKTGSYYTRKKVLIPAA